MPDLITPHEDQIVAVEKFRDVGACLIGDEMGVGKTVTAIERDFRLRKDHPVAAKAPTLIVCKKIGLGVWTWHLRMMGVPPGEILVIDYKDRTEFVKSLEGLREDLFHRNGPGDYTYYVMHYDAIRLVEDLLLAKPHPIRWFHIIADEVHFIKNRTSQRTKLFKKLLCTFKTGCTGTPADNEPGDFWSILNWLYPRVYRSYWRFYDKYIEWEEKERHEWVYNRSLGKKVLAGKTGYREMIGVKNMDQLHKEIGPFYCRRMLLDVEKNMPPLTSPVEPPIMVDMTPAQRRAYDQMAKKSLARIKDIDDDDFVLIGDTAAVTSMRLQQMALATLKAEVDAEGIDSPRFLLDKPSPKLDALMEMITDHPEESFVAYSWFRAMVDLIEAECRRQKITCVKIHGGVTSHRERLVDQFQRGEARVFTGTIATVGESISLTAAHHAIFTDRSHNPNQNLQAERRLWRRGQKEGVRIYHIQSRDSIDQVRWEKIQTKADLVDAINNPGAYT